MLRRMSVLAALAFIVSAAGALPAQAAADTWTGTTSAGSSIYFTVDAGTIQILSFDYPLTCPSAQEATASYGFSALSPIQNDRWRFQSSQWYARWDVRGVFDDADNAHGTLKASNAAFRPGNGTETCVADLTWTAQRSAPTSRRPAVADGTWTGQTSQGFDFSLTVASDVVTDISLPYTLSCPSGQSPTTSYVIYANTPVVGDVFVYSVNEWWRKWTIRGKFSATKVNGGAVLSHPAFRPDHGTETCSATPKWKALAP